MATFLDVGMLEGFKGVFSFILVWVITFGILELSKPFGDGKKGLHSMIAAILAFFVLFSAPARETIGFIIPWATVLVIAFFFLIFGLMVFGKDMEGVNEWLGEGGKNTMLILLIIIAIFGLSAGLGSTEDSGNQQQYAPGPGPNDTAGTTTGLNPRQVQQGGQYQAPQQGSGAPAEGDSFADTLVMVFTHPKFLGIAFILLLGNFTIVNLSKQE